MEGREEKIEYPRRLAAGLRPSVNDTLPEQKRGGEEAEMLEPVDGLARESGFVESWHVPEPQRGAMQHRGDEWVCRPGPGPSERTDLRDAPKRSAGGGR